MTEVALLRLASVPTALVEQLAEHARGCPRCRWSSGPLVRHIDTRACERAEAMIEGAVNYEAARRHPEGTAR